MIKRVPWNKGLKCSEETKRKISDANKGRKHTIETRDKVREAMKGHPVSSDTRKKLSKKAKEQMSIKENRDKISGKNNYKYGKTHVDIFGSEKADEIANNISNFFTGKTYEEIFNEPKRVIDRKKELRNSLLNKDHPIHSSHVSGPKHPLWNPNRDEVRDKYTKKFYSPKLRENIFTDQLGICLVCGNLLISDVCYHHIDYDKKNDDRENLMVVHRSCNFKVNYDRDVWYKRLYGINVIITKGLL